jgi:hypothetical protein
VPRVNCVSLCSVPIAPGNRVAPASLLRESKQERMFFFRCLPVWGSARNPCTASFSVLPVSTFIRPRRWHAAGGWSPLGGSRMKSHVLDGDGKPA